MTRRLGTIAAAALSAAGALAVPAGAQAASDPPVLPGAVNPSLTPFGTHGLLLVAEKAAPLNHANTELVARVSTQGGAHRDWQTTVRLGRVDNQFDSAQAALNARGAGAVMWSKSVGADARTLVRLRRHDGSWSKTYQVPHSSLTGTGNGGVAVSARGEVVVLSTTRSGRSVLAVHRPGHRWQVVKLPPNLYFPSQVGLDARGGIHIAETTQPRGGNGYVTASYRSPGGTWSGHRVKTGGMVETGQLLVAPDGSETLVVGRASRTWISTLDTEAYWPTQYDIFARRGAHRHWHKVWHRMGASEMTAVASEHRVRLTWTQYVDPNSRRAPQTIRLQTRSIRAGAPVRTLATQATHVSGRTWDPDFATATAIGADGCRIQVWTADATGIYGGVLTSVAAGHRATYPDAQVARSDVQAAPACAATGHAFLARTANERVATEDDGQYLVGGDIVVVRAG